jgi:hypothetical protein
MKKFIKKLSILACLLTVLILPYFVFASGIVDNLKEVGPQAGYSDTTDETSMAAIAGTVVNSVLGLLGVIFVILIIYAGIIWMTAEGDEAKVEKAQKILKNAIIGLIITISVFAIYAAIRPIIYGYDVG